MEKSPTKKVSRYQTVQIENSASKDVDEVLSSVYRIDNEKGRRNAERKRTVQHRISYALVLSKKRKDVCKDLERGQKTVTTLWLNGLEKTQVKSQQKEVALRHQIGPPQ